MAKRKHHRTHHRRRSHRRVGATALNPRSNLVKLGSAALGYLFLADPINTMVDKSLPTSITAATDFKKYLPGIAEGGIGALLLSKKGKSSLVKSIAGGVLIGVAAKRLLRNAGVITGYQTVPVIGARRHRMAGYQSTPVVGGVPPQLAGSVPAQLQGYRVDGAGYVPVSSGSGQVMGAVNPQAVTSGSGITTGDSSGYMQ